MEKIFQMSIGLHGKVALEPNVNIDTTVQEKNITYSPTSALNSDLHPVRPKIQEKTDDEMEEPIKEKADEKEAEDVA